MLAKYSKNAFGYFIAFALLLFIQCSRDRTPSTSKINSLSTRLNPADTFSHHFSMEEPQVVRDRSKIRDKLFNFLDTLSISVYIHDDHNRKHIEKELREFYRLNNHDLYWSNGIKLLPTADFMLNQLLLAETHGLESDYYSVSKLLNLQQKVFEKDSEPNVLQIIHLDIRLSIAYVTYAWHLHNGAINAENVPGRWVINSKNASVASILATNGINEALNMLEPARHYKLLMKALEKYRQIAHEGGWSTLPPGTVLKINDCGPNVLILGKRLKATGDLREKEPLQDSLFDSQLENAVKRFQHRHGLTVDGVVGKTTLAALNIPVEQKIDQILINLERMRWRSGDKNDRYIEVNVPEYKLYAYDKGEKTLEMKVIVGKEKSATPIFNDTLEYLVFSPRWTIPKSILHKEIIPAIEADPSYLARCGYQLYDSWDNNATPLSTDSVTLETLARCEVIRIVQPPGPKNSLGQVKFMMPNKMNIYLHDTPADYLFLRDQRAFSHGCIRLEFPELLADYLLSEWDLSKVLETMNEPEPFYVNLKERVPVYLLYQTAWVDSIGLVNFREDIYDHDKLQLAQLKNRKKELMAGI
ncbi:L,D-transpeptidase family protein [Fulvivirga imtechensis]|nr:L,D-transpeptidase family protein [Fulvivirga imtechensis]